MKNFAYAIWTFIGLLVAAFLVGVTLGALKHLFMFGFELGVR